MNILHYRSPREPRVISRLSLLLFLSYALSFVGLSQSRPSRLPATSLLSNTQCGFQAGTLVTLDDLRTYWDHSPSVGGFIRHVVSPEFSIISAGTITHFEATTTAPAGLAPDLLMLHLTMSCEVSVAIAPRWDAFLEPGLTTFSVATVGSRAVRNLFTSVESEIGISIGTGVRVELWDSMYAKLSVSTVTIFTGPTQLQFHTANVLIPFFSL